MTDINKELQEVLALAADVQVFLASPLGRYLEQRAEKDIEDAQIALVNVDPHDSKEIARLQNIAQRHRDFAGWLNELATAGDLAYRQYVEDQRNQQEE